MKQITLKNGTICVVSSSKSEGLTLSATVKVGHLNEPKLGLASVYEKVLMLQDASMETVYGGTITSYLTGGLSKDFRNKLAELAELIKHPELSTELLKAAVADIVQHTRDRNALPRRQLKLLYKHTAFSGNIIWDTEAYVASLESLTVEDLKEFHDKYYTGKNLIIGVSGVPMSEAQPVLEELFSDIPAGKANKAEIPAYTGGYEILKVASPASFHRVLIGWDVSGVSNMAEANVMMSMLYGRLERSFAESSIDVTVEVKVAGYYGCRTLRIAVECPYMVGINRMIDIVCANIKRLKHELASERRMETSRNRAMTEKLLKFQQPEAAAVEISWQILHRGSMYNIADRINATWQVSARDVQDISKEIFNDKVTCVIGTDMNPDHLYSLNEIVEKMK